MAAALPAGMIADRWRRDRALRLATIPAVVGGGLFMYALLSQPPSLTWLAVAVASMGCYSGSYAGPIEALCT